MSDLPSLNQTPSLTPGFRFQWEEAQDAWVLLYPEGMVTLGGSAGEILKHCDGEKTLLQVCEALEAQFPGAELRDDVLEFVAEACGRGWLRVA